jgi:hypothetical protein
MEFLEKSWVRSDPKSEQLLWDVWVSESNMKFHEQWNWFVLEDKWPPNLSACGN